MKERKARRKAERAGCMEERGEKSHVVPFRTDLCRLPQISTKRVRLPARKTEDGSIQIK